MNSIDAIQERVLEISQPQQRIVRGLWSTDCFYNPDHNGRIFDYKVIVTQTVGQGCAYSLRYDYDRKDLLQYVGKDCLEQPVSDVALRVSMLDSLYGYFFPVANQTVERAVGSSYEKLSWRTNLILREATRLLGNLKNKRILNVGVVGDILKCFHDQRSNIVGTDYDETIIGTKMFHDVEIYHGDRTLPLLEDADLAIVTGMTITTQTIDSILEVCRTHNTKVILFAETGANLGSYYLQEGADVFLGETYPFYIFNGQSEILVGRG